MATPSWGQAAQEEPAPKKSDPKSTCLGCGCLGVIAAAIAIGIASCAAGTNNAATTTIQTTAATASPAPSDTPTSAAPTTDPNAAIGAAVAAWWVGGGQSRVGKVSNDFSAVATDASNQDVTSLGDDCSTLSSDVTDAQSYDAVPDPTAEKHWSTALADYQEGATDCVSGASSQDATLITRASQEMAAGNKELDAATARIQQLNGSTG